MTKALAWNNRFSIRREVVEEKGSLFDSFFLVSTVNRKKIQKYTKIELFTASSVKRLNSSGLALLESLSDTPDKSHHKQHRELEKPFNKETRASKIFIKGKTSISVWLE